MKYARSFSKSLVVFICLAQVTLGSGPVSAQETAPGDACVAGQLNNIRSVGGPETTGVHRLIRCNGTNWVAIQIDDLNGSEFPANIRVSGDITPASITADQNDYNPTGLSTATVLRLSTDASRNITGLQGGADGGLLTLLNVGTFPLVLKNQDAASTAANRFAIGSDITLNADQSISLLYDSTSSRWRVGDQPINQVSVSPATVYFETRGQNSCGLRPPGAIFCVGNGFGGRNGDGTTTNRTRSVIVDNSTGLPGWSDWMSVDYGAAHGCGIRSGGTAWCWGQSFDGELGDGASTNQTRPVQVQTDTGPGGWTDWEIIQTGRAFTCGIRSNGTAWCWGEGVYGKLGDGASASRSRPVQVQTDTGPAGWTDWFSMSLGTQHTCGIRSNGSAWCWGEALSGKLGDGQSATDRTRPIQVQTDTGPGVWTDWTSIDSGGAHTCGIRSNGTAWCWGEALSGKLGDGQSATDRTRPVQVQTNTGPGGWADWISISAGRAHTCGIRSNGTSWCWGEASSGKLGDGQSATDRTRPVQVQTNTGPGGWTDWASISVSMTGTSADFTCGVRSGGSTWCWGDYNAGQMGNGANSGSTSRPIAVGSF